MFLNAIFSLRPPTLTLPLLGGGKRGAFPNSSPLKGGRLGGGSSISRFGRTPGKTAKAQKLRKNQTDAEKLLWSKLRGMQLGVDFRRQHPVGNYILDFYCPSKKLAIELDGGQHNFSGNKIKDKCRDLWLSEQGVKTLRFWNNDVLRNPSNALETIYESLR